MEKTERTKEIKEKAELLLSLLGDQPSENWDEIDLNDLQRLLERLLQIYAHRVRNMDQRYIHEHGMPRPLPEQTTLTQTDAVIFIDQLLQLKEIELFEVQMWRSIG